MLGSLVAAFLTAAITEGLTRLFRLSEDASVGLVFSALFALGILLVTLYTRDVHLGVEAIMGNADALQSGDFKFASLLAILNLAVFMVFYRQFKISAFDRRIRLDPRRLFLFFPLFALIPRPPSVWEPSGRSGVLLVLAFLTGPFLTARLFSHRLSRLLWLSPALGVLASAIGVALSRYLLSAFGMPLSTGGIVVCVIGLFYAAGICFQKFHFRSFHAFAIQTSGARRSLTKRSSIPIFPNHGVRSGRVTLRENFWLQQHCKIEIQLAQC